MVGLASDRGQVALALFDSAESFAAGRAPLRRAFLPIEDGGCVWSLDDLPVGDYAVKVFHDLDGSGSLDYSFVGAPSEPYGFSNDARGSLGPPGWGRARFRLDQAGRRLTIRVR